MAEPTITVEPRAAASPTPPAPTPTEATNLQPPAEGGVELPDDLLKIPAMQALVAGQPAAFSALLESFQKRPEAKVIAQNKDSLMKAGFNFYRSLDGSQGVVFNQLFLSPDEIKAADQAGTLAEVAPPFEQLNESVAGSGAGNPVLGEGERPTGFKTGAGVAPVAPPPAAGNVRPASSSVQKTLANKRANNLTAPPPTGGAAPGGGQLLNAILKPVL